MYNEIGSMFNIKWNGFISVNDLNLEDIIRIRIKTERSSLKATLDFFFIFFFFATFFSLKKVFFFLITNGEEDLNSHSPHKKNQIIQLNYKESNKKAIDAIKLWLKLSHYCLVTLLRWILSYLFSFLIFLE